MSILVTRPILDELRQRGVECFLPENSSVLPDDLMLEPPCSLKWMQIEQSLSLSSFSYAVSGYFAAIDIGRYVSIGEQVQAGRGDHPTGWLSTSPSFYLHEPLFNVGRGFPGAAEYGGFEPSLAGAAPLPTARRTTIGNDVWIGHGAFIRPGVTIGDGAIIGACTVVTRDVPAYGIVVGNPGVVRRQRFAEELAGRLRETRWWTLAPWQLRGIDISRPHENIDELERRVRGSPPYQPGRFRLIDLESVG